MIKHTHEGKWESGDGTVWVLVEPSEIWSTINAPNATTHDGYVVTDHGDGTGTRTTYDENGEIVSTEHLTGLPIPQPPEPSDAEKIASLQATIGVMTETLAQISPEDIAAATQLAVAFLANKDRLNNAVNSVANNNTAKAPVVVLNDIVQGVGAQ